MNTTTTARLLGVLTAGLLVAGPVALASAEEKVQSAGPLRDVATATADVTDRAVAHLTAEATAGGGTHVVLKVQGLDRSRVGDTFGAHVHVGPCVAGNGGAALGHYQAAGFQPPATAQNEVWLDFTVEAGGVARSEATVPFGIAAGERSVVIHAQPTAPGGAAGPRLACLPVQF